MAPPARDARRAGAGDDAATLAMASSSGVGQVLVAAVVMQIDRTGCTRIVFKFKHFVVKIPVLRNYYAFIKGLTANMNEEQAWRFTKGDARLCPVLYGSRTGLICVMRRVDRTLDDDAWFERYRERLRRVFGGFTSDFKRDAFGWLDGRLVIYDYGQ